MKRGILWIAALLTFVFSASEVTMAQDGKHIRRGLSYLGPSGYKKKVRVETMHAAGLKGDRSQLPLLLETLNDPEDDIDFYTALHAVGRIGDPNALTAIETAMLYIDDSDVTQAHDAGEIARARLLVEQEVRDIADPIQRAAKRLSRFLQELHLTVNALNAIIIQEKEEVKLAHHGVFLRKTFVLRELADMIYQKRDTALIQAAKTAGIRFDLDAPSQFKIQLAPLSRQERVDWLVNTLANRKTLREEDDFLMQLAADEGKMTSQAIVTKLKEMDMNRDHYADKTYANKGHVFYPGYTAMFRVLGAIGDKEQEPLIAQYMNDPEDNIAFKAQQVYPDIRDGVPMQKRIGY